MTTDLELKFLLTALGLLVAIIAYIGKLLVDKLAKISEDLIRLQISISRYEFTEKQLIHNLEITDKKLYDLEKLMGSQHEDIEKRLYNVEQKLGSFK